MRLSLAGLKVLSFLLDQTKACSGSEIIRAIGIKGGTLYPLLARFEEEGWVSRRWEKVDPENLGRSPRLYKISRRGRLYAENEIRNLMMNQ